MEALVIAKILAVDDEPEIRSLLELFLTGRGFQVLTAANGLEALAAVEQHDDIDIILLDLLMPKLTGTATLEELRRRQIKIPVILITGAFSGHHEKIGASALFIKPLDFMELLAKINEILGL
ncbi:MAG: response regulator [Candidatus Omnitrophota bacterium]